MTPKRFHELVMSFPETEEGTSYGMPAYKAFGKFFTRLRVEDASCVIGEVDFDERDILCEAEPQIFHFTEHYRNYRYVLARIAAIEPKRLQLYLARRWRKNAPKAWLKAWEAGETPPEINPVAPRPASKSAARTGAIRTRAKRKVKR